MATNNTLLKLESFHTIFPTYNDFETNVINKLATPQNGKMPSWASNNNFYQLQDIYNSFVDKYAYRFTYHQKAEFMGYFRNLMKNYLPRYYSRNYILIMDELKNLDIDNIKSKSKLSSQSRRSDSTNPYNNSIQTGDVADNFENNIYDMETTNPNILEAARVAALAKIGGELEKFLNSFEGLFTKINLGEHVFTADVNKQLGHSVLELYLDVKKQVDAQNHTASNFSVVDDGGKMVLQPKAGMDLQLVDDSGNPIVPTSPNSAISKAYVDGVKTSVDNELSLYEKKSTTIKPTLSHQAGYIVMDEAQIKAFPIGTHINIDLREISKLSSLDDNDRLFAGATISTTIKDNVFLKYNHQTNPTDTMIKDNYENNFLTVEKIADDELRYVEWTPNGPYWKEITPAEFRTGNYLRVRVQFTATIKGFQTPFNLDKEFITHRDFTSPDQTFAQGMFSAQDDGGVWVEFNLYGMDESTFAIFQSENLNLAGTLGTTNGNTAAALRRYTSEIDPPELKKVYGWVER